jgi:predicted nucleic acid-binding protein
MAAGLRYTAVLDACVLYPAPMRDLLLSLAVADLYTAKWTSDIEREWLENLLEDRPDLTHAQLQRTCALMSKAIPDSKIEDYERLIPTLNLPDEKDRHVLAAAIRCNADAIVTMNLKDFPQEALDTHGIEALHPDDFVMNQIELSEPDALRAIKAMRLRLKQPTQTAAEFISTIERCQMPLTGSCLREWQTLI